MAAAPYSRAANNSPQEAAPDYDVAAAGRPPIYYGDEDGPFEASSSVDDDSPREKEEVDGDGDGDEDAERGPEDGLLGKAGEGDEEVGGVVRAPDRPRSPLRWLIICLSLLLSTSVLIGALAARSYRSSGSGGLGRKPITMDHVFNGTFSERKPVVRWVPEAGDGVYSRNNERGDVELVDLHANTSRVLLRKGSVHDHNGRVLLWKDWKLSPDMNYILLKTDYVKQWRYSSFGNYYIHSLVSNSTHPLNPPTFPPITSYATWSPTGESLAYVHANDLYVRPSASPLIKPIRVTFDGNSSLFNGVPDWVYEEEVFGGESALWWSPDSQRIAFLKSDETAVNEFTYPVYNPTENAGVVTPYTSFVTMKYPKPGFANPIVTAHLFDLSSYDLYFPDDDQWSLTQLSYSSSLAPADRVIQEVVWVGNDSLLLKEVNRSADEGGVLLFTMGTGGAMEGKVVRRLGRDGEWGDGGWIDSEQRVHPLHNVPGYPRGAYIDILPTPEGYNHLALFASADASEPYWLTKGSWEVTGNVLAVDRKRGVVHFQAAAPSSTERHIYTVTLPQSSRLSSSQAADADVAPPTALTDLSKPGYFSATFSPRGGWYVLHSEGPDVPWWEIRRVGHSDYRHVLEDNSALNETSAAFAMPVITYGTIEVDGYEMNTLEMRPPNMDDSGRVKYPVLFRVYGGPASQTVNYRFARDWHHYLTTSLRYIVVSVDGRGTGFKGRPFRNFVRGDLGNWEVKDQVEAARRWAAKAYVDKRRIGIWGWSYGGYMTCKTLEADAGVHSLGMAVAPVTDWRLYDSIYTERYMRTPTVNLQGYVNGSVTDVKPFGKVDFLLAHGSGDDNVHFANSAHLLDELTAASVQGFRFRMFTDSDHSINKRGAYRELHEFMTAFLIEKWGKGGVRRT